jgi:hypothetical protein
MSTNRKPADSSGSRVRYLPYTPSRPDPDPGASYRRFLTMRETLKRTFEKLLETVSPSD